MKAQFTVLAFGPANHFVVTPQGTPTAGAAFNLTVTAEDRNGNVVTNYSTPITSVTSSAGGLTFNSQSGYSAGVETITVTPTVAVTQQIFVSNGSGSGSAFVTVQPAAIDHFKVTASPSALAGSNVNISVTAFDRFNNVATNYGGKVHFSVSPGTATLPPDSALTSGGGSFGVTFNTPPAQTITVNDTVATGATGQVTVTVNPANCTAAARSSPQGGSVAFQGILCFFGCSPEQTSPYPSQITVSGFPANQVVGKITVTLNGFKDQGIPNNSARIGVMLVGPSGQSLVLMSGAGNSSASGIDLVFDDAATSLLPQNAALAAGTFQPTDYSTVAFLSGAPASPAVPAPAGGANLESVFSGTQINGTWSLYMVDTGNMNQEDLGSISGWSLNITPAFPFSNGGTPVTFTNGTPEGVGTPYPSQVDVSGLQGNITSLTLTLNNLTDSCPAELALLLVGPQGQEMVPMSVATDCLAHNNLTFTLDDAAPTQLPGFGGSLTSGTYRPLSDEFTVFSVEPAFPAPAPAGPYLLAAPDSPGATFTSAFGGTDPNGTWSLYVAVQDQSLVPLETGQFAGGWSLSFQLACPPPSACAVSANPAGGSAFNQTVTFTSTVTTGGATPVTLGNVQFFDGASPVGTPQNLNASGQAQVSFANGTLAVGAHAITAQYNANFGNNTSFQPSTSPAVNYTVVKADTATGLGTSATPVNYPATVTFTAKVTPAFGGVQPTSTVTFKDVGTALGPDSTLNGANPDQATFATTAGQLHAGTHSITANYNGDGNFNTSISSPALNQVVNQATTALGLSSNDNPANFGDTITFTATLTSTSAPAAGTPTPGSVTFKDGVTALATVPSNAGGVAQFSTSTLAVGTHTITAGYAGSTDGNFAASNATLAPAQTVNKDATTSKVILFPSAPSQQFGSSITVTAKISVPTGTSPTGTVSFSDNGVAIAGESNIAIPGGSNQVSFNSSAAPSAFTIGGHSFTAAYSGDGNYLTSTSPATALTITSASTTSAITGNTPNPSSVGQAVMLTANVSSAAGTPTGTVVFSNNGSAISGGLGLDGSGNAGFSTSALPQGSDNLTVAYSSNNVDFAASDSTGAPVLQTVNAGGTVTTLALAEVSPAPPGQDLARHPLTFTATVTVQAPASGTPTGAVTFTDNGAPLTTPQACTLSANGANTATCNVILTLGLGSVGRHSLVANYAGDASFAASSSSATAIIEYRSPKPH